MLATEIIKTKKAGHPLSHEQIDFFINGYTQSTIPDYQMSALLMAICLQGMNDQETLALTKAMLLSGTSMDFGPSFPVDKHSTGGVGDKTSLILGPIVAACGVPVPMISGRGLGHTGGTLDKLESIPGFDVNLDLDKFKAQVDSMGLCFIGQTPDICPADKKIYALRDVTGTVESLPLICASIMSKKIAEGIKGLVLDVKTGSGAFMKTVEDSMALAKGLVAIGEGYGLKVEALITDMNQPLGRFCGNAVEVGECLAILSRTDYLGHSYEAFSDTEVLSVELAAQMIAIGLKCNLDSAREKAKEALNSGAAFEKFSQVCAQQMGRIEQLPAPSNQTPVVAQAGGYISSIHTEQVGVAGIEIGAGRKLVSDIIDPVSGIEVHHKIGDSVKAGQTLFTIHHSEQRTDLGRAETLLADSVKISSLKPNSLSLLVDRLKSDSL